MTVTQAIRIGTRDSRLALAQTSIVADALRPIIGDASIVPMRTRGDAISARRPRAGFVESDGQFTREIERALLAGEVDLAVHSFKDLPTEPVDGLVIGAVLERADPRDCLLTRSGAGLDGLPFGGRVGTSSTRRAAQLAAARCDLIAMPIRGNVESRIRRLERGEYEGLVLAAAGLDRLGIGVPNEARLPLELMLPAPAQGALAVQVRADDASTRALVARLDHRPTRVAVDAERALLRSIGGGCLAPLGALGEVEGDRLRIRAAYEDAHGALVRVDVSGPSATPEAVVADAAAALDRALSAR